MIGAGWVELATGLHYLENGEWKETREEIEIVDGIAVARHGPHQATFASNLHSPGAITLVSADGKRFRSHVLGLAYTDAASGRSVMIATVRDCVGALVPPRQILYANAFDGDCEADVRYTYSRRGFEQDVILREAPPSPAEWGLNPDTTRLEVFTEFIELPPHRRTDVVLRRESDRKRAARMAEPDLIDQHLDFGSLRFGPGQVFPLETMLTHEPRSIPTGKSLEVIDRRVFLIEKVDYPALSESLARLPQGAAAAAAGLPGLHRAQPAGRTAFARHLPPPPDRAAGAWKEHQLARTTPDRRPGLVLDYLALQAPLVDWRFRSDTTYLVTDTLDLDGHTVLEGTVIKFAPGASLQIWGDLDCQTSTYSPAILTARNDPSVGLVHGLISGRIPSGGPRGNGARTALSFRGVGRRYALQNVSIRHAETSIQIDDHVALDLAHAQIVRGGVGVAWGERSEVTCRNFLFADLDTAWQGAPGSVAVRGEHGTVHRVQALISDTTAPCRLTNSLLVAVTNNVEYEGEAVVVAHDEAGVFQAAGGGAHYLAASGPHRNAGTVAIEPELRAELRRRTTEAPVTLGGVLTHDAVLRPTARRDSDQPDLGYHYPSLDYLVPGLRVAQARLTLAAGVTLGMETASATAGLALDTGAGLVAQGRPDQLIRLVSAATIQEGAARLDAAGAAGAAGAADAVGTVAFVRVLPGPAPAPAPTLRWRFVESILAGGAGLHLAGHRPLAAEPFAFQDCRFAGAGLAFGELGLAFTNCIFDRVNLGIDASGDDTPRHFHQNFFRGGTVQIELPTSTQVHARNNFFEQTRLRLTGTWIHSHNAYVAGSDRLQPASPTDRVLTEPRFQAGPLGPFYYPSDGGPGGLAALVDAGSGSAPSLGLSHHTTRADLRPESASRVDIGFHYVATDVFGQPLDLDLDGLADDLEDANGNDQVDPGETDWRRYTPPHPLAGPPGVLVFTPLE